MSYRNILYADFLIKCARGLFFRTVWHTDTLYTCLDGSWVCPGVIKNDPRAHCMVLRGLAMSTPPKIAKIGIGDVL